MANLPGTRIRSNNIFGSITDNPLTSGGALFNSPSLADMPAVTAGNHLIVTLDPLRQYGFPEIVMVTAHTASATVASIQRGMYGTTPRSHPSGSFWAHAGVVEDFIPILTSVTRPADPYRGEMIFETDTNSFVARDTSDVWQTAVRMGAWTAFTPTPTPTSGAFTTASGSGFFTRTGRTISYRYVATITTVGSGTGDILFVPPAAYATAAGVVFGNGREVISGNSLLTYQGAGGTIAISGSTLASGKVYIVAGTYEASS